MWSVISVRLAVTCVSARRVCVFSIYLYWPNIYLSLLANVMVTRPHAALRPRLPPPFPLYIAFLYFKAGPYIQPLRPVPTYPAWAALGHLLYDWTFPARVIQEKQGMHSTPREDTGSVQNREFSGLTGTNFDKTLKKNRRWAGTT